jgi:CubicO group peptidase (beta-lactamase class C family)
MAGSNSGLSDRLQSLLDSFVDEQANVRNGLLLVEGPGFKWKGASGVAVPESELSMLPDDQFNIDSIAKMMTATIVMKLVEAGELRLDDPICQYLPDSLLNGLHVYEGRSYSEEITVQHLLTHASGIADDWAHPEFLDLITADTQKRWTPEETVEFVKEKCQPRMFNWVSSGPFHNYGFGISRVLFDQSDNPKYIGLGEIWGHSGSSDNFIYYWPSKDTIMIGTLNQIACERDLYDNVTLIMSAMLTSPN